MSREGPPEVRTPGSQPLLHANRASSHPLERRRRGNGGPAGADAAPVRKGPRVAPAPETRFPVRSPAATRGRPSPPPGLLEEERLLLAKLRHMTGGSSPVSGPRRLRRLVPDPEGPVDLGQEE